MDSGYWSVCEQTVILQGAFLLAEKLIHPKTLLEIKKADWHLIEKTITDALKEISSGFMLQTQVWRKRAIALLWARVLCYRTELLPSPHMGIEKKWKEDDFFPVESMIPRINHTILFELLKTLNAAKLYAELLLALPAGLWVEEATLILEHICDETTIEDVAFFLDVWWEVMKSNNAKQDETIEYFSFVVSKYFLKSCDEPYQSAKRFKTDPEQTVMPSENILTIFLEGIYKIRQYISTNKLKCFAIANLAEMLCSSAFLDKHSESLPIKSYLEQFVGVFSFCNTEATNPAMIKEAERIVQCRNTSSKFRLLRGAQHFGLSILKDFLFLWGEELMNYINGSQEPEYEYYRMNISLESLHKILKSLEDAGTSPEEQVGDVLELTKCITAFQETTGHFQQTCPEDQTFIIASIAMKIIEDEMDRYKEVCSIFASEPSWAFTNQWLNCLKKCHSHFQHPHLVLNLLRLVVNVSSMQSNVDVKSVRKGADITLSIFSELSLTQKNEVLKGVLSSWGMKGLSQFIKLFSDCFQDELNTTFNQISESQSDYSTVHAVSKVSKLALLNPQAVVNKACHFAVVNTGAHIFLAKILNSLLALCFKDLNNTKSQVSLLCQCLMQTCWGKLSSDKEERQFLALLTFLMEPSEIPDINASVILLQPSEVVNTFVLPYVLEQCVHVELCLHILYRALNVQNPIDEFGKHWVLSCSPFPLIMSLCKLLDSYTNYWQNSDRPHFLTLSSKDLITEILTLLNTAVMTEADNNPEIWNKSLFWLHRKMENLDWVVCLRLKAIFGKHFKNEVPAPLFEVCKLSQSEWTPLFLPEYGPGTGLLAWLECCCISFEMKEQMIGLLSVDCKDPEEVNLFSKGFLVAMIQVLPWCSSNESKLITEVIRDLLQRQIIHVPYTLEYVQYMPLLNLRPFAYNLQFSVLLLRGFQLLCSSSCSDWLSLEGLKHIARLYSTSVSDMIETVKQQLSLNYTEAQTERKDADYVQEAAFIYTQVYCHVLHIIAMMPDNTCETLYFLSLEILSLYETLRAADTSTNSLLRRANERYFLKSITENVSVEHHRKTLLQKINKL
ncbi:hypothetical protein GDO86_003820 [Hymenochirus boettgeri]|uniref:Gem-associated protein 4 n=1 Tax=Hymenochirus boettgeri TaxID=247094 RepID=A0A8T2KB98_9PIPI|nr:hypothetical protein GDO86_003820 [Hymenochirus boettgeri]